MTLRHLGFIDLPAHAGPGGFDHAAVHVTTGLTYVAHPANDALDVIDCQQQKYVGSITGLTAVAGALVADDSDIVFTSNRGENTVGMLAAADPRAAGVPAVAKIPVGIRPNGLAFSPRHARLLVAHVGDPVPASCTVSVIDVAGKRRIADLPVAGRTRWTVYDPVADVFHVNIMDPAQIVVVNAGDPIEIRRVVAVPHAGPHGLDIDAVRRRLFCACDAGVLVEVDADTGALLATDSLAGEPDVVFFNAARARLYVAIGDPGLIEVFDTRRLRRVDAVRTEIGAHTLSYDASRDLVGAFLPATHRAAVYRDQA